MQVVFHLRIHYRKQFRMHRNAMMTVESAWFAWMVTTSNSPLVLFSPCWCSDGAIKLRAHCLTCLHLRGLHKEFFNWYVAILLRTTPRNRQSSNPIAFFEFSHALKVIWIWFHLWLWFDPFSLLFRCCYLVQGIDFRRILRGDGEGLAPRCFRNSALV